MQDKAAAAATAPPPAKLRRSKALLSLRALLPLRFLLPLRARLPLHEAVVRLDDGRRVRLALRGVAAALLAW